MTRIKLVLAQPRGFVLSKLWQVTVTTLRWLINHVPIPSGDVMQARRSNRSSEDISCRSVYTHWFGAKLGEGGTVSCQYYVQTEDK